MSCVEIRKESSEAAAAPPSSSSSRKRTRSEEGGVNKRNVSRCKAKRFTNNTNHGGVDTSQINPTRSNQNDKNDYGLDPLSNNNFHLSNYNETATNNNYENNNVSKSPNINEENDSTPASPPPNNKKRQLLQPSPNRTGNGNNNSNTNQNELDDDEKKRILDELIDSLGGEKSKLKEIVPTILDHLPENQVLPIIKDVIISTANLAQHTKAPPGEREHAKAKRLRNNKKLAAEGRKIGDKARTKLYKLFVKLLGDEFANRVNIERFDMEFMGFLIKHFGTQKENGNGTDNMNCHNPDSSCIKKLEKDAPTWCLNEQIDASVPKGKSFVIITKTRANSSTTWAQPDALFPEKASQYEEVMRFLRSDEESIKLYFDTRTHALHWANKYFGNGAAVGTGYHATAVSGPELPPHLESGLPSLGLTDLYSTTLDNPNEKLTKEQKAAGVKPPPSLLDQRTVIADKLQITDDQLLTINWAFQALQSVIFVLENDRPAPLLIASEPATKFMIGEHINCYGLIIRTGIVFIWRINHSQSIFEGAHLRWGEKHQHGINEAMSGFWSEVTQLTLFTNTKFSTSYPPSKKAEVEEWREAWAAVKRGNETPEQRAILEGTRSLLLHEGWKNVHSFGDLSELSAELQDFFTNDPVGKQSLKVFDSWKKARLHECNLSDMPADVREYFTNDPFGKKSWDTFEAFRELDANGGVLSNVSKESRAILDKNICYKTKKGFDDLASNGGVLSKVSEESRAILDKNICYKTKKGFDDLDSNGGVLSNVSKESRAVLEESSFYNSMDTALTEHAKTIEQMKEDRSNYVLVGTENVFYIPASKTVVYHYVSRLRHLAKDNWKRLKFEQAAGISLSKMEFAYSQLSMKKQCAPKKCAIIDKRLEQEKMIQALAEKNRQAAMKKRGMQQRQQMEQPRLSAHQQMEQLERVAISVVRPSKEVELGLGVGKRDDRMTVTSIAPGIFDGSQLKVGMIIDSVNGSCPLSYKDALLTLQNAEGRINIVALKSAPKKKAVAKSAASKATGIPSATPKEILAFRRCSLEGCSNKARYSNELCGKHLAEKRKADAQRTDKPGICARVGCANKTLFGCNTLLCRKHFYLDD